jgi:hypothetical protein
MFFGSSMPAQAHAVIHLSHIFVAPALFRRMHIMGRRNGGIHLLLGSRCIAAITPENVDACLNPHVSDLAAQYAILDGWDRPYYAHRLAA